MKVVVDTNVLVSGLLSPYGPPGRIVHMLGNGMLRPCGEVRIWNEYRVVLYRPKFKIPSFATDLLLAAIQGNCESIEAGPLPVPLPHAPDEMFLEVALAARAECLITGNLRHYPSGSRRGMRVLLPREFIEYYRHHAER